MERKVACIETENGSNYDDCRKISKVGYELRDGVYERSPEYIHRRIDDEEEFYIEADGERIYLQAVSDADDEDEGEDGEADGSDTSASEEDEDEDDDEDVRNYVRAADEDTADDPLLELSACN